MRLLPVVERVAREVRWMFSPNLDIRDLTQAGAVGLVKAADAYKPSLAGSAGFDSYAWFRVRGAIIDSQKRRAYREEQNASLDRQLPRPGEVRTVGDLIPHPDPLADELAIREEAMSRLTAAIAALSATDRRVIQGHLDGERLTVTAAAVGHSVTWTRARLAEIIAAIGTAVRGEQAGE